jgi:hypothetical protein
MALSANRIPKFIPLEVVGDQLGVSAWTARTWARQGMFPTVKIGRRVLVNEEDILKMIAERTVLGRVPVVVARAPAPAPPRRARRPAKVAGARG